MKMKIGSLLMSLMMLGSIAFISSCGGDDNEASADKEALIATIEEAQLLLDNTQEGRQEGQYLAGSKAALQTAVDAAQLVVDNNSASQTQVDNANVNLQAAITLYESKKITPVASENLMLHLKFDEGTGTVANDATANNLDGTFKTGHAFWGAGTLAWTADRYGNANKALAFDKGSNVEIPYNTKLNPAKMTISLWFKQTVNDPIVNNQYMVAMNRWNGYKLNMQEDPKVFFTVKPQGGGNAFDHDHADPILAQGQWYHAVVTFGDGHMIFYVNGVKTRDWDDTPGTIVNLSSSPVNLTIGQDLPTTGYSTSEADPNYLNWGGFFIGSMDEIRIYNAVLTEAQVTTLYNSEKP